MAALLGAWRRRHPRAFRIGFWYSLGAVSLPSLWLAALGLAPEAGLTRSYWYPVDASTEPIIEERITAIDLAFIDERHRPTRNYRVRWEGVWFSPRAERVEFYAGADDGVILRVDGDTVLERSPAVGMHTVGRTVELGAGAHRLEIEYWQHGGARSLNVQWAPAGGTPALPGPTRLFPEDPGALGYWLQVAAVRFPVLILLVWTTGVAVLVGLTVWRAFYRRITSLSPDEWGAGFAYYLPPTGASGWLEGTPPEAFERFERRRSSSFRSVALRFLAGDELRDDSSGPQTGADANARRRVIDDELADEALTRLLSNPAQHLKVGVLLAWRGVFVEEGQGFLGSPLTQRLADIHGLAAWPRWRRAYGATAATLTNIIGFFSLFLVPLWFWLGRGRFECVLVFLPALYLHGAYSLASHFLPRYALPEIPLRITATALLLHLVWSFFRERRKWRPV